MGRSFDNVDFKVAEAEYFLERLSVRDCVHPEIDFLLSAYASAARSITFTLKAVLNGTAGFAEWYSVREEQLRANGLARYFLELRNVTQKTGATVVNRSRDQVQLRRILLLQLSGKGRTWFGDSGEKMPPAPDTEVAAAAQQHFRTLLEIVYECYVDFGPLIDPQQHYTPEHFERIGKTIEDAEEELGYPRGWTSLGKRESAADIPYRFEMLRRHAAGECAINDIFLRYLGRTTPAPRPLPPPKLPDDEGWSELKSGGNVWIPQELRKTGTPEGDIDAYIASLKRETPVPVAVAVAAEKDDFHRLRELIFAAVSRIQPGYFEVPVAGTDELAIRERIFCYEFYHQLRLAATDARFPYMIGGELDKGGHPIIRSGVIPDFVVHDPGNMDWNLCVLEVKPLTGARDGFMKDLTTLRSFVRDHRYHRGVLLVFGDSPHGPEVLRRKVGDAVRELGAAGVFVWWARRPGEPPEELH